MKKIYHITARRKNTLRIVDLYYTSIEEASHHNPGMEDFIIIGRK